VDPTWTFDRDGHRLVLQRQTSGDVVNLVILSDETSRRVPFSDMCALVAFQSDMEEFLVRTGWSLVSFSPNRRRARDRRLFPRENADRRRWWTEGTGEPKSTRETVKS
jgi:hypothetical protein